MRGTPLMHMLSQILLGTLAVPHIFAASPKSLPWTTPTLNGGYPGLWAHRPLGKKSCIPAIASRGGDFSPTYIESCFWLFAWRTFNYLSGTNFIAPVNQYPAYSHGGADRCSFNGPWCLAPMGLLPKTQMLTSSFILILHVFSSPPPPLGKIFMPNESFISISYLFTSFFPTDVMQQIPSQWAARCLDLISHHKYRLFFN